MLYRLSLLLLFLSLSGCATYQTPGAGAILSDLTASGSGGAAERRQPGAAFPARIALVRVQAAGYGTTNPACYGTGRFCVMTVRNIEAEREIQRLQQLPQVAGLVSLPPDRLPPSLNTVDELRPVAEVLNAEPAVAVHAGYTFQRRPRRGTPRWRSSSRAFRRTGAPPCYR